MEKTVGNKRIICVMLAVIIIWAGWFPWQGMAALQTGDKATVDYTNVIKDIEGKSYNNPNHPSITQNRYLLQIAGEKDRYCYCIDPGTDLAVNGSEMTATSIHGAKNYWAQLSKKKKQGITLAAMYGWRSNAVISQSEPELKGKVTEDDVWYATQCIIWEYVSGYRTSPVSRNNDFYFNCLKGRSAEIAYKWILEKMRHHTDSWSFAVRKTSDDTVSDNILKLKWDQQTKSFRKTVTDSNKIEYGMKNLAPGTVSVVKKGYTYTFVSEKALEKSVDITFGKDIQYNEQPSFVWEQGNAQVMYTGSEDLIDWTVKVITEKPGYLKAEKRFDDSQKIEDGFYQAAKDVRFVLKGDRLSEPLQLQVDSQGALRDSSGKETIKLWPGNYTLEETQAPERYRKQNIISFSIEEGKITSLRGEAAIVNDMKEGTLSIKKVWNEKESDNSTILAPEQGIEFLVMDLDYFEKYYKEQFGAKPNYGEESNITADQAEAIYGRLPDYTKQNKYKDRITTDQRGEAKTKALYYGGYVVIQITENTHKWKVKPFTVFLPQEGVDTADKLLYIENKNVNAEIRIEKRDMETGKLIPLAGAQFKVRNKATGEFVGQPENNANKELQYVFTTDKEGIAILPQNLSFGDYEVVEIKAPYGYVLPEKTFDFAVNTATSDFGKPITVEVKDMPQKGIIDIVKLGISYKSEKGKLTVSEFKLPYVAFDIVAAEDIRTGDGTVRYRKDETVDSVITDEEGRALTKELYLGRYKIVEKGFYKKDGKGNLIAAENPGWKLTTEKVTLSYEEGKGETVYVSKEIRNQPNGICITKKDETTGKELAGAEIRIFDSDKECLMKGVTDESGKVYFTPLKAGTYYFQEAKAPEDYSRDKKLYPFEITETDGILKAEITNKKKPVSPKTGEGRDMMYVLAFLAGAGAIGCMLAYKKEKQIDNNR